jgi:hypothetical protein
MRQFNASGNHPAGNHGFPDTNSSNHASSRIPGWLRAPGMMPLQVSGPLCQRDALLSDTLHRHWASNVPCVISEKSIVNPVRTARGVM